MFWQGSQTHIMKTILLVEDHNDIAVSLSVFLRHQHYQTLWMNSASMARAYLANQPSLDMAIIDWMMPGESGLSLVQYLRATPQWASLPILMLTAKSEEGDRVMGLEAGADDYLCKPFSHKELAARIAALFRRAQINDGARRHEGLQEQNWANDPSELIFGALRFVGDQLRVDWLVLPDKKELASLKLSLLEFKLMLYLARYARTVPRSELIAQVWGSEKEVEERTVDVTIGRLRKQIDEVFNRGVNGQALKIEAVRGVGYRLCGH